ncbi:MAG: hypothetical protein R2725_01815 [Solirubrobacterales bacterium]
MAAAPGYAQGDGPRGQLDGETRRCLTERGVEAPGKGAPTAGDESGSTT